MARPGENQDDAVRACLDPRRALPKKRSLTIAGHRTSITIEDAFWAALKAEASGMGLTVTALVAAIDACRGAAGLSAAVRVFLLARRTVNGAQSGA